MATDTPDPRFRRIKIIEIVFFIALMVALGLAVLGDSMSDPGWFDQAILHYPLGVLLLGGGLALIYWCDTYGRYTLQTKVEPYRAFYEWFAGSIFRRLYFSATYYAIGSIFAGSLFAFMGFAMLFLISPK